MVYIPKTASRPEPDLMRAPRDGTYAIPCPRGEMPTMTMRRSQRRYIGAWAGACSIALVMSAAWANPPLQPRMGQPLPGLSALEMQRFGIGRQLYGRPLTVQDGLGPVMNKSNCSSCHTNPTGGWGSIAVTHFGIDNKGEFELYPGESQSLFQLLSLSQGCAEVIPSDATVVRSRVTNSSMAFGLIEAIPDSAIAANADPEDANGDGISGRVHWVVPLETPGGAPRAGRFGWKAQVATVLSFSGDAARNEMGLTNRLEPHENAPNNDTDRLPECDAVEDVEDVEDTEGFAFIDRVTHFQRYLAPPPQTPKSGMSGEAVFTSIGCAACHIPAWSSSQDPALEDAIRGKPFRPYSDFLIHDMGLLGDGIQQADASESEMRTPVLWGLRRRDPMLHDGRAAGGTFAARVTQAIAAHGPLGEGAASAESFSITEAISRTDASRSEASSSTRTATAGIVGRLGMARTRSIAAFCIATLSPAGKDAEHPDSAQSTHARRVSSTERRALFSALSDRGPFSDTNERH